MISILRFSNLEAILFSFNRSTSNSKLVCVYFQRIISEFANFFSRGYNKNSLRSLFENKRIKHFNIRVHANHVFNLHSHNFKNSDSRKILFRNLLAKSVCELKTRVLKQGNFLGKRHTSSFLFHFRCCFIGKRYTKLFRILWIIILEYFPRSFLR